jgi:hypothetical protein
MPTVDHERRPLQSRAIATPRSRSPQRSPPCAHFCGLWLIEALLPAKEKK